MISEKTQKHMEAYRKALAAHREQNTPETAKALEDAIRAGCPWVGSGEDPTAADTFRDHSPVDQIHRDYEVWDRHYG